MTKPTDQQTNAWALRWQQADLAAMKLEHFNGSASAKAMLVLARATEEWGELGSALLRQRRYLEKSQARGDWLGLAYCGRGQDYPELGRLAAWPC